MSCLSTDRRYQPTRAYQSNDNVMTPPRLATALVATLRPSGTILEPCAGTGNFVAALTPFGTVLTCERDRGQNFFAWTDRVDWIFTNPPWSQFRAFLTHALEVADHVAFLVTINHMFTRARRASMRRAGFGLERVIEFDSPCEWPQTGFQLGMVLLSRGYQGACHVEQMLYESSKAEPPGFVNGR